MYVGFPSVQSCTRGGPAASICQRSRSIQTDASAASDCFHVRYATLRYVMSGSLTCEQYLEVYKHAVVTYVATCSVADDVVDLSMTVRLT